MRSVMRLIGLLAAVLLFAVPVLGISAQGGQLPVTGRWDDGIFVPSNLPAPGETELTIGELAPSALPMTGRWDDGIFVPSNLPAPGETELTIGELAPSALPVTGRWDDGIFVPSNLPAPGETELTIGELAPSALPESGSEEAAELGFIGVVGPNGMPAAGVDEASYLWGANTGLGRTASGSPKALPQTGTSPSEPPYYEALPVFLASASTNGKTGQDTQTILDGIAGGVRNITEILPEELAAVGR